MIILILLIGLFIYLYIRTKKKLLIPIIVIVVLFSMYSLFTYSGSARLRLVSMGYPIKAYQTELEEYKINKEYKFFYPTANIQTPSGHIGLIRCKDYIIKICEYYGFG